MNNKHHLTNKTNKQITIMNHKQQKTIKKAKVLHELTLTQGGFQRKAHAKGIFQFFIIFE